MSLYLEMYRDMLRIRMVEEEIAKRYKQEKMRCPIHLSIGQEAVAVGVCRALRSVDLIISNHRCHAHYLAKGGDLVRMLAELHGKATGCCRGRGGSMHLYDKGAGMLPGSPIVGSSIPLGVGAAYAIKNRDHRPVVAIFCGDTALETGIFWESLNMALLWKLPVLFVIEDNNYSVETPLHERQPACFHRMLWGNAWYVEMPNEDFNDAVRINRKVGLLRDRVSRGGPIVFRCETWRSAEHCGPRIECGARDPYQWEYAKQHDPLEIMLTRWLWDDKAAKLAVGPIRVQTMQEIVAAFDAAEAAPAATDGTSHVYA